MARPFRILFTNLIGCAAGISDISWVVTIEAASEAEALERALEQARALNRGPGLPPHGLRVSEKELRRLACVLPQSPGDQS